MPVLRIRDNLFALMFKNLNSSQLRDASTGICPKTATAPLADE